MIECYKGENAQLGPVVSHASCFLTGFQLATMLLGHMSALFCILINIHKAKGVLGSKHGLLTYSCTKWLILLLVYLHFNVDG